MRRLMKSGSIVVLSLPLLILLGAPRHAAAQQGADSAGAMRVIAAYVKAVGGEAAIRGVTHQRGTVAIIMEGATLETETLIEHGRRLLIRSRMNGEIISQTGWDGTMGWMYSPVTGALPVEGPAIQTMRATSDLHRALHQHIRAPRLLGASTFGGKPTVAVRMTESDMDVTKHFDPQTHLLVGTRTPAPDDPADSVVVAMSDYEWYGPVRLPALTTIQAKGQILVLKILQLSHTPLDSSAFEPPAEVRTLRPAPSP